MTDETAAADSPRELLATYHNLTRQVRSTQRRTWLPLLILAVIMLAAIPLYRYAPRHIGPCRAGPNGTSACVAVIPLVLVYWPVVLVLGYAAIATFYIRQSRRQGVGTRIRAYVVTGIVLAVLFAGVSVWHASELLLSTSAQLLSARAHDWGFGLVTPAAVIGLALLVLAWVERSWALLAYSLLYVLIVLVQEIQVNRVVHSSLWYFLPQLLVPAGVLMLGSAAFALIRSVDRRRMRGD